MLYKTKHVIIFIEITKGFLLRLCYLYSKELSYPHVDALLDAFNSTKIALDTTDTIDHFDIYVIELHDVDKDISVKLKAIFAKKSHSLIYFIIPTNHTLLFFQLAFLLNAKSIITHTQDINKLITRMQTDEKALVKANREQWLGSVKINTQNFLVYKNQKLIFMSGNLLKFFSCENELQFKEQILPQIDLENLLHTDMMINVELTNTQHLTKLYEFKSLSVSNSDQIIYVVEGTKTQASSSLFTSRLSFVEILKEKIIETSISESNISLLTISIENAQALANKHGVVNFENLLVELLSYMNSTINHKVTFSQFEQDFYVILFENIDYKDILTLSNEFYAKVLKYIQNKEPEFIFELFTFNLDKKELNSILSTLNEIQDKKFILTQECTSYINNISSKKIKNSVKDILQRAYLNKINFKILNIYHGLVINTASKIVKVTKDSIYIKFESLQGVVLKSEKRTVLQSEYFSHDILAEVKQINLRQKIAVLENFKFLKTNANARQYARVEPSIKTPININIKNKSYSGIIIDLSIKSIAIQMKNSASMQLSKLSKVSLVFNLPDELSENGYIQLSFDAKIIFITDHNTDGYKKIICDLEQETHDVDIVLKYVYERQKELIQELKKMSKLN